MFIYEELKIKEDFVNVELTETAVPDRTFRLNNIGLKKGDGTFVVFKDDKLAVASSEE